MDIVRLRGKDSVDACLRGFHALTTDSRNVPVLKLSAWLSKIGGFLLTVLGIALLLFVPKDRPHIAGVIDPGFVVIGMGAALFGAPAIGWGYMRWATARALKKKDPKLKSAEYTFTAEAFHIQNPLYDVECKWRLSPLAVENASGLLITVRADAGYWVDATWFHSQAEADQVTHWARAGVKKYKVIRPIEIPHFGNPGDDFTQDET